MGNKQLRAYNPNRCRKPKKDNEKRKGHQLGSSDQQDCEPMEGQQQEDSNQWASGSMEQLASGSREQQGTINLKACGSRDSQQGDSGGQNTPRHNLICNLHCGQQMLLYCVDHDRICCQTCTEEQHESCIITTISEEAEKFETDENLDELLEDTAKVHDQLNEMIQSQTNTIQEVQEAGQFAVRSIRNQREDIDQQLDIIEQATINKAQLDVAGAEQKIQEDINNCSVLKGQFSDILQARATNKDKELAFTCSKICPAFIAQAKHLLDDVSQKSHQMNYTVDDSINRYVGACKVFGEFNPVSVAEIDPNAKYVKKSVSLQYVHKYSDHAQCSVTSITEMPNGCFIITDGDNHSAKMLDQEYTVVANFHFPYPMDACMINDTDFAVCGHNNSGSKVQVIHSYRHELYLVENSSLFFGHRSFGINYHAEKLYIASGVALFVYNIHGKPIKKLYALDPIIRTPRDTVPFSLCRFAIAQNGKRIHIANPNINQLITLDDEGNVVNKFCDAEMIRPTGVCIAGNGSLIVCSQESYTVIQVDKHGQRKLNSLATSMDGLWQPRSVCYSKTSGKLLVGQISDYIAVLSLNLEITDPSTRE